MLCANPVVTCFCKNPARYKRRPESEVPRYKRLLIKILEAWEGIEIRYIVDTSALKDYFHTVPRMIPLTDGAKVDVLQVPLHQQTLCQQCLQLSPASSPMLLRPCLQLLLPSDL